MSNGAILIHVPIFICQMGRLKYFAKMGPLKYFAKMGRLILLCQLGRYPDNGLVAFHGC